MTFERILDELTFNNITPNQANDLIQTKENKKVINSFINRDKFTTAKLNDAELTTLNAIVNILQIIYNSGTESCISDSDYDIMQELLISEGIPRLTGSQEFNDRMKLDHKYMQLRGTLHKVYYLTPDEKRVNPSRKYLDEKIKQLEDLYYKRTGTKIDLNEEKVLLTPKWDGCSCILEIENHKMEWLTRGDTDINKASDITSIMKVFNDVFSNYDNCGIKFEVVVSEEAKDEVNRLYQEVDYKNSRSIVSAIFNSNEPDFRVKYLYPIPLRVINKGETIETVANESITRFPSTVCKLKDREMIREFSKQNKFVVHNSNRFRTDGVVITILNQHVQEVLGRADDINNFEIAYKFTEEYAYTTVESVEFYVSEFGYITPVLVVVPVKLKGNTIDHPSLSNKERFDELNLSYGDDVKILYDIIPYATLDENCKRSGKKKIEFIKNCPSCGSELDLNVVQVQCHNPNCECRIIGRILNYCSTLRIKNIGYSTIETLWNEGLLKNGIRSLYKLKKKMFEIEDLNGFGKLKTAKMIKEIESKRRLKDYEFFGAYGIEGLSTKSFQTIFSQIKFSDFCELLATKNYKALTGLLEKIDKIGEKKAELIVTFFKTKNNKKELDKILDEIIVIESYGSSKESKGTVTFSMFRSDDIKNYLENRGYIVSDSLTKKTKFLVIPDKSKPSSKIEKASEWNIPVVELKDLRDVIK